MKKIYTLLLLLLPFQVQSQNMFYKGSPLEVTVSDDDNFVKLYSPRALMTYNETTGELKLLLNTSSLTDRMYDNVSSEMDLDLFMPPDSILLLFTAMLAPGTIETSGTAYDLATKQVPGYVQHNGIQYSVIANYAYTNMNATVNDQKRLYMTLDFKFNPDGTVPLPIRAITFPPRDVLVEVREGYVNFVNN